MNTKEAFKKYMIRLLESKGYKGDMGYDCTNDDIIEYYLPGGAVYLSATINLTESSDPRIKIMVNEIIGRRSRPVQVHFHFIKVKGQPGVYFIENCVVQKIIRDKNSPEYLTEPDEATGLAEFNQELLLDQAEHMPDNTTPFGKMEKQNHVKPISHIGRIKTKQDHVKSIKSIDIINAEHPDGIEMRQN